MKFVPWPCEKCFMFFLLPTPHREKPAEKGLGSRGATCEKMLRPLQGRITNSIARPSLPQTLLGCCNTTFPPSLRMKERKGTKRVQNRERERSCALGEHHFLFCCPAAQKQTDIAAAEDLAIHLGADGRVISANVRAFSTQKFRLLMRHTVSCV